MISSRFSLLFLAAVLLFSTAIAQPQAGSKADSTAQLKVLKLLEKERILTYYNEDEHTPGDYIYSSLVATTIKQKPTAAINSYWIQVIDNRRYESSNVYYNFYVEPNTWEVLYIDTKTNLLWTWDNWKKQSRHASL